MLTQKTKGTFFKADRENGYILTLMGIGVLASNSLLIYFANHPSCFKLTYASHAAWVSLMFVMGFLGYIAQTHPKFAKFRNLLTFAIIVIVGLFYGGHMAVFALSENYFCDLVTGQYIQPS